MKSNRLKRAVSDSTPIMLFTPPNVPYPGIDPTFARFRSLVSSLSRDDALFWVARLNLILSNPNVYEPLEKQRYCVSILELPPIATKRLDDFVWKNGGPDRVTVFFRAQLLELVRWILVLCDNHPTDGITFDQKESRRSFAQAAFIGTELWRKRTYHLLDSDEHTISSTRHVEQWEIRKALQATGHSSEISLLLSRIKELFLHVYFTSQDPDGKAVTERFFIKTGLTPVQFFECATLVYLHCAHIRPEDPSGGKCGIFTLDLLCRNCPDIRPQMEQYIALVSQSPEELKQRLWKNTTPAAESPYSYRPFLVYPIIQFADGRAIIMDLHLYVDSVLNGSIFLSRLNRETLPLRWFGDSFEKYCRKLLQPPSDTKVPYSFHERLRDQEKPDGGPEADALYLARSTCVLIEAKHAFLVENEDDIDSTRLIAELEKKYGKGDGVRGYAQLGRLIRHMIEQRWKPDIQGFNPLEIFPVLVVSDKYITSPLTIKYLADQFDKEFPGARINNHIINYQGRRIHRLVVLDLEEVERLGRIIDDGQLVKVLDVYSWKYPTRMRNFTQFISVSQRWVYRPRASFIERGILWLDQLAAKHFPQTVDRDTNAGEIRSVEVD